MPLTQEARDKTGYVPHADDREGECFYCRKDGKYKDYVPPRDVHSNPELRSMVKVPFVYVSSCHPCKTALYAKRYLLITPETRRSWLINRKERKSSTKEDIASQLRAAQMHPWQRRDHDTGTIYDLDDWALPPDLLRQKQEFYGIVPGATGEVQPTVSDEEDFLGLNKS